MCNVVVMSISRLLVFQWVILFLYSYEADFVQHLQKSKFKKQKKHPLISLFALLMMFYHWITLSSMIIFMLFIRRNLRLKTLQIIQNGLIILSLKRMVNFSHEFYDKRDDFDFPIVNLPFLSSNIHNPLHMVFLFHSRYVMLRFVRNMKIFCSEGLFWFQSYWSRDIFTKTSYYFSESIWSSYRPCSQIWHLCVTYVEWFVQ